MLKKGDRVRVINEKSTQEYAADVSNGDEGTFGKRLENGDIEFYADGDENEAPWYLSEEDVELIPKEVEK